LAYSLGSIDALYNLGTLYESGRPISESVRKQEIETAILYYKDAASQGCIKSQLRLGALLSEDSSLQDITAAKEYLLMAATDNTKSKNLKSLSSLNVTGPIAKFQVEAQNLLGECYEIDSRSYTDLEEAAHWYLEASRSGHARATFNLGNLYETGQGVTKDFKKAVQLYQEAIIRGSAEATSRIKELEKLDLV
jgi:TPR repeat protein